MTNDLFRDLLENKIPGHETPTTVFVHLEINTDKFIERIGTVASSANGGLQRMGDAFQQFAESFELSTWQLKVLRDYWDTPPTQPTADPRARALWAKEQQGHGPAVTPLRVRGRTTHYKEKR